LKSDVCLKFPRSRYIRNKKHFGYVFANSKKVDNKYYKFYYSNSLEECGKLAVVFGRKIGKAVIRNRFRRKIKECFRLNQHKINWKYDYIIIAKQPITKIKCNELYSNILRTLKTQDLVVNINND
jgi:ribonuclease P protein component